MVWLVTMFLLLGAWIAVSAFVVGVNQRRLDPAIAFGAPIVEGTAVRTDVVAGLARRVSPEVAAQAFRLTLEQAQAAAQYETRLAQAA